MDHDTRKTAIEDNLIESASTRAAKEAAWDALILVLPHFRLPSRLSMVSRMLGEMGPPMGHGQLLKVMGLISDRELERFFPKLSASPTTDAASGTPGADGSIAPTTRDAQSPASERVK